MAAPLKTHCLRGHEYTPENSGKGTNGFRCCIECRRLRQRKFYRKTIRPERLPHPIVDYLDVYGNWRTALGIATDLKLNPTSTERMLYRFRARGLVVDRTVGDRTEWRAA